MADSKKNPSGAGKRSLPAQWVRGTYTLGLEVSSFRPKGSQERWWTPFKTAESAKAAILRAAAQIAPVDVELFGVPSNPGAFGHMGMFQREFIVGEIRLLTESEEEREP